MPTYTKETALYDTGKISTDITSAGQTASKYITAVDQNGIKVHAENAPNSNYSLIDGDGLTVYKSANNVSYKVAKFGDTAQIGADGSKNMQIDQSTIKFNNGSDQIAGIYSSAETTQTVTKTGTDFALLGEHDSENEAWETPHRVILSGKHYQNLSDDSFEDIGVLEVVANNEQDSSKSTSARIEALAFNDGQVSIWMRLKRGSTEKSFSIDVNDTQQIIQTDISRIRILNESDPVNGQINFDNGNITARNIGVPDYRTNPTITKTAGSSTCGVVAYSGYGKMRMLILAFTATATISSGANVFTGTITTTDARPKIAAGGSGFYGSAAVIGNINASGTITIRMCGGSISSGGTIWVYFTYFVA